MTPGFLHRYSVLGRLLRTDTRRGRVQTFSVLGLALVAAGFFYCCKAEEGAPGTARSLEAERFVLVDKKGRTIAELAPARDGLPALVFKDEQGRDRVRLALRTADSPALSFHGPNGQETASLALVDGSPVLTFHDRQGRRRAVFTTNEDGAPSLRLLDTEGKARAVLGAVSIESPQTEQVETRPVSSLVLFNKFGEVTFEAPIDRE